MYSFANFDANLKINVTLLKEIRHEKLNLKFNHSKNMTLKQISKILTKKVS